MHGGNSMKAVARDQANTAKQTNQASNAIVNARTTSIDASGKYANAEVFNGSEVREMTIMLPYGISSSALDGMGIQVVMSSSNNGTVVGVDDKDRPVVKPGEVILYSKFGSKIEMLSDGRISLIPGNGGEPLVIG